MFLFVYLCLIIPTFSCLSTIIFRLFKLTKHLNFDKIKSGGENMSVSYEKLHKILNKKGYSIGYLISNGIIGDFSGRKLRRGEPVDLKYIDNICQFLQVPIEQIVEIKLDERSEENTSELQ